MGRRKLFRQPRLAPGERKLKHELGERTIDDLDPIEERESDAPPVHPPGDFEPQWLQVVDGPRVNVTAYHHRAAKPEEPS